MYTENSKSIITFNEPTQPLLYSANNTQEHYTIDAMSPILPIVLKYYYDNTQKHYTIDTISPIRKTKYNCFRFNQIYNKSTMNKEQSFLSVLGIGVCLLTALYLSKNITDKTTYKSCIDSLANALYKYQNAKYNKERNNQPRMGEKVNTPIEMPNAHAPLLKGEPALHSGSTIHSGSLPLLIDEISDTEQHSLPRLSFSNILNEIAAIALLFAVVLLFLFVLHTL